MESKRWMCVCNWWWRKTKGLQQLSPSAEQLHTKTMHVHLLGGKLMQQTPLCRWWVQLLSPMKPPEKQKEKYCNSNLFLIITCKNLFIFLAYYSLSKTSLRANHTSNRHLNSPLFSTRSLVRQFWILQDIGNRVW